MTYHLQGTLLPAGVQEGGAGDGRGCEGQKGLGGLGGLWGPNKVAPQQLRVAHHMIDVQWRRQRG